MPPGACDWPLPATDTRVEGQGVPRPREPQPTGGPGPSDTGAGFGRERVSGKIRCLRFDCYGDFSGFVLDTCGIVRTFDVREPGWEPVVRRACERRSAISIVLDAGDPTRIAGLEETC
jgi:hypothetical protein